MEKKKRPRNGIKPNGNHFFSYRIRKLFGPWTNTLERWSMPILKYAAAIEQSVQRLATDWAVEKSEFDYSKGQDFSPLHVVQTCSCAH
jgi:hypothetical protein